MLESVRELTMLDSKDMMNRPEARKADVSSPNDHYKSMGMVKEGTASGLDRSGANLFNHPVTSNLL